jgi:hypothetical protein
LYFALLCRVLYLFYFHFVVLHWCPWIALCGCLTLYQE